MPIDFRVRPPYEANVKQKTFQSMFTRSHEENVWTRYRAPIPSWDQEDCTLMIKEMDEAGVNVSVVMGRASEGGKVETCPNEDAAALIARYPDRLVGFAGIDGRDLAAIDQIKYWIDEKGFRGICLDPGWSAPAMYADNPVLDPIYAYCEQKGIIVSITQSGLMGPDVSYCDPVHIQHVAARYRRLDIVLPHACWPEFHKAIFMSMAYSNVYLIPDVYFYNKGMYMLDDFITATNWHIGPNVLFASSYPLSGFAPCIKAWKESGLNEKALRLTLGDNAARLLKL